MIHAMNVIENNSFPTIREYRENTSEPIYEAHRRKELEGRIRSKLVFFVSSFLAVSAILTIGLLQYDEFFAYINDRTDYIENTKSLCKKIEFSSIDIIATPIAGFLVLLYILIYKRRVFLRNKFKYRNVGIPMIISCWNKTDRMFSAFTYGLIAFNVFGIVKGSLNGSNSLARITTIKDPTGLLGLLYKVLQMFLIGIRYYPILVAYRANAFIISITCVVYLWIDFLENIYLYGKCDSISSESSDSIEETTRRLGFYITYKVLSAVPLSIFSSFIIITLTYKSAINLIDFILRYRTPKTRSILERKSRDTVFCMIANVDDDNEIIYSKYDFDYVLHLFEKNRLEARIEIDDNDQAVKKTESDSSLKYVSVSKTHNSAPRRYLKKFVYHPEPTFRFTSRYWNTIMVGLVALYYVFLYWTYTVSMNVSKWVTYIPETVDGGKLSINPGELLCQYIPDACLEQLALIGSISLPLPNKIIKVLPSLRSSILAVVTVPLFVAVIICVIQVFFLVKETKQHLVEMYQGKCEFVRKASSLNKESIASSSFHFGGYMVGYLIWGYFIIYFTVALLGAVILVLRIFIGDDIFWQFLLRIVPVVCVLVVKTVINTIATNYWFLFRKSKILALNNFRAFNVFLYFNFYFDCFMGIISAVIRLIRSLIIAILMMPSKIYLKNAWATFNFWNKCILKGVSYSFMGRHFERQDAGYSCYSGFLHMEAMHTNPIIICFCSILYYKDLSEHLRRYRKQRRALVDGGDVDINGTRVLLNKFTGRLSEGDISIVSGQQDRSLAQKKPRNYKTRVLIRWHLYLRMTMNKEIIKYRKIYFTDRKPKPKEGIFSKVKNKIAGLCRRKSDARV